MDRGLDRALDTISYESILDSYYLYRAKVFSLTVVVRDWISSQISRAKQSFVSDIKGIAKNVSSANSYMYLVTHHP